MKFRSVLKEYEAHLQPTQPGGTTQGKSEWKQYGDGTYRFKISIRKIQLPDNSTVNVNLDEMHIATLKGMKAKAKLDTQEDMSIGLPNVKAGQILRIMAGENIVAEGKFAEE